MTTKSQAAMMAKAVRRYVESGDYDSYSHEWPGTNYIEKETNHHAALRDGLLAEVRRRADGARPPSLPEGLDLVAFTRSRVGPMVEGLFPAKEHGVVLGLLERSVVFLTSDNVEQVLTDEDFPSSAWDLANLYLGSLGREALDGKRADLVGLSQETTCFVALTYFAEDDRFADFVVHEAAHVFHNWKREYAGMPFTRTREWLLEIEFRKRETFAYACEAFSRILAIGATRAERERLLEEYAAGSAPTDERVDGGDVVDILREAVAARNGWKRILSRCAPVRTPRRGAGQISPTTGEKK
jgi:hypothetical protein